MQEAEVVMAPEGVLELFMRVEVSECTEVRRAELNKGDVSA
jgi:hypothetical protein